MAKSEASVRNIVAIMSTCQRFLDKKYISRVEIPFTLNRKGTFVKVWSVVYISPAIVSLEESRDIALGYCRYMKYTDVTTVTEIDLLPEPINGARLNRNSERAKKKESLSKRPKSVLN